MQDLHNYILDFDAEQVYLELQFTNVNIVKNKEVALLQQTLNPKPFKKNWSFENPKP